MHWGEAIVYKILEFCEQIIEKWLKLKITHFLVAKPFSKTLSFKGRFPHIVNASIYDAGHVQKNCRAIKISNTIKIILRLIVGFVVVNIMVHTL